MGSVLCQGQKSAQGILRLRNPNSGPNSVKRILDARILDPNSWVEFFDSVFSSKRGPLKNSPSRNSPPKIHLPKFNPEIGPKKWHCTSAGQFGWVLCCLLRKDNSQTTPYTALPLEGGSWWGWCVTGILWTKTYKHLEFFDSRGSVPSEIGQRGVSGQSPTDLHSLSMTFLLQGMPVTRKFKRTKQCHFWINYLQKYDSETEQTFLGEFIHFEHEYETYFSKWI